MISELVKYWSCLGIRPVTPVPLVAFSQILRLTLRLCFLIIQHYHVDGNRILAMMKMLHCGLKFFVKPLGELPPEQSQRYVGSFRLYQSDVFMYLLTLGDVDAPINHKAQAHYSRSSRL